MPTTVLLLITYAALFTRVNLDLMNYMRSHACFLQDSDGLLLMRSENPYIKVKTV